MNKSFKEFVAFFRKDTYVVTDNFLKQVIELVEKVETSEATKRTPLNSTINQTLNN